MGPSLRGRTEELPAGGVRSGLPDPGAGRGVYSLSGGTAKGSGQPGINTERSVLDEKSYIHYILWLDKCRIQYIVEFLLTQIFIYANIVTVAHT